MSELVRVFGSYKSLDDARKQATTTQAIRDIPGHLSTQPTGSDHIIDLLKAQLAKAEERAEREAEERRMAQRELEKMREALVSLHNSLLPEPKQEEAL